ncbi:MAG: TonB-dependent receptor plug domain-containing protein [Crocinitomicaceae bacterium]|nr:TonB-dependent receptor plug domain-containing protein [Crocinitomicaceae bacterium]
MVKLGACTMLMLFSISSIAGVLKGKVVAECGAEMNYVAVVIGEARSGYSDEAGNIFIKDIPNGTYNVSITTLGYAKLVIADVHINNAVTDLGLLKMEPMITIMDPFEIVYIRPGYSHNYHGSSNLVLQDELRRVQPLGSEEVLKKVVGVNVAGDMGISNRLNVGIRGSYPRRSEKILLLEDGIPIAPAPYLSPSAYYNPPTDRLDGIEIVKGADALTMGPNNMYGVLNYITKKPSLKPELSVALVGGERGYQSQFITYGGTWNNVGAELQVLNKAFDGFQDNTSSRIFNATGKVYADLGERSTAYVKFNFHQENAQATYSGQTPLTFNLDPNQNPFDADDLSTKRYAIDLIYKYKLGQNSVLTSTAYASQFSRDWWRQNTTLLNASAVRSYVGEEIYNAKYAYLNNVISSDDDYVRVGVVSNGRENTKARNRVFRVAGVKEEIEWSYSISEQFNGKLTVGLNAHTEQFLNQEIVADSSRFSRSGTIVKDQKYTLSAISGFIKNDFIVGRLSIAPTIRYEVINMRKYNLLAISSDPLNDGTNNYGSVLNTFGQLLPGVSLNYVVLDTNQNKFEFFGGGYNGYTPPTSSVGFVGINEEGTVDTAPSDESINIKAETSTNFELGLRGYGLKGALLGQAAVFHNGIDNYYAAGRKEAFETLGAVSIQGIEFNASYDFGQLIKNGNHELIVGLAYTLMNSKILSGKLKDADLFKAKHTEATKIELIDKINLERTGYSVFFAGDSLVNRNLNYTDFDQIESLAFEFGEGKIANNAAPYVPAQILCFNFNYGYKGINLGLSYSMIGAQYTEYLNFNNETAEGAIGKLDLFNVIDANVSYEVTSEKRFLNAMTVFVAGKNLRNQIYKASRLHRVSSGIMPGGFRQINAGIKFTL